MNHSNETGFNTFIYSGLKILLNEEVSHIDF